MRFNLATLTLLTFVSFTTADHHSARGHHKKHVKRTSAAIPSNWLKGACMVDADVRLLQQHTYSDTNTPAACIATCTSLGFSIAGVEYGAECWCGNTIHTDDSAGQVVDDSECNTPCAGDPTITCGGSWKAQVYSKQPSPAPIPSTWTEGDCVSDAPDPNRVLLYSTVLPNNTPANCIAYCTAKDYHVAGVQYGQECWCGDAVKVSANGGQTLSQSKCDTRCAGNNDYTCGGAWTMKIYKNKTPTPGPDNSHVFKVSETMQGSSFFDHWNFWTDADPTGGQVKFLSKSAAASAKLAYVQSNGVAIMKVDNTTTLAAGKSRNSVRVSSKNQYNTGLFIFDIAAMPYGCSLWPALWTVGPDWPNQGELDILEGINLMKNNQYTLHTGSTTNCTTEKFPPRKYEAAGRTTGLTCASSPENNSGCTYVDDDNASFGAGFNAAGGAVFAVHWETTGIRVWRFGRKNIPADIKSKAPKPNSWPKPIATWASTSCDIKDQFKNQNIIFDITLCGSWAGPAYPSSGCPGTCVDRIMNPANFNTAAWAVNSVIIYK